MSHLIKPPLGTLPIIGHPLAQGLVGCWLMNEGGGDTINDLSGNGNTGTFVGDTHFVPGKFGPCLDFDGTGDYVDLGNPSVLKLSGSMTISAWVYPTSIDSGYSTVLSHWGSTGAEAAFNFTILPTTFHLQFSVSDGSSTTNYESSAAVVLNSWNHILVSYYYSGSPDSTFCINRVMQFVTMGRALNTNPTTNINVGRSSSGSATSNFIGQMDNVMIYNRALGADEIQQLYSDSFAMFRRTPIELWTGATSGGITPTEQNAIFFGCNF